jgi:hypothetical protein
MKWIKLFENFDFLDIPILENEEYIGQIMELIESFDETNIDMAFQIAKGLRIKQSTIL